MAKWWLGLAVIVLGVGSGANAQAQDLFPSAGGSTATDPAPYAPAQNYGAAPAAACPTTPTAPVGLPSPMPALPGDTPNISTNLVPPPAEPCVPYADVGALWLMRQRLGNSVLAVRDPVGLDTGNPPPVTAPVEAHFGNFQPGFEAGVQATLGYKFDGCALEIGGFWIPRQSSNGSTINPGRLNSFFFNPPLGFEGDNGLWLQADQITTTVTTTIGNAELNARWWSHHYFENWELITGVRYMDIIDQYSIFTDDDGILIRTTGGQPDPTREATYFARAHNHIIAPQVGLRWCGPCCDWMSLGFTSKFAFGPDIAETEVSLVRGDGLVAFDNKTKDHTSFSQIYDLSLYLTIHPWEGVYVRSGYIALWAVDVAEGQRQVDFNLEDRTGKQNYNGSIFFNGPFVQVELFF